MEKYEYKRVTVNSDDGLDTLRLAAEGWEVVTALKMPNDQRLDYYLKRQVKP